MWLSESIYITFIIYKVLPTNPLIWSSWQPLFHFRDKKTEVGSHLSAVTRPKPASGTACFLSPSLKPTSRVEDGIMCHVEGKPRLSAHAQSASPENTPPPWWCTSQAPRGAASPKQMDSAWILCKWIKRGRGAGKTTNLHSLASPRALPPMCSSQFVAPVL